MAPLLKRFAKIPTVGRHLLGWAPLPCGQRPNGGTEDTAFGYACAGTVYAGHPLERCFCDIHTANQHIAFSGDAFNAYSRDRFET